jgi:uncharacterized protein YraI
MLTGIMSRQDTGWMRYVGAILIAFLALSLVPTRGVFAATRGVITAPELNVRVGPGKEYAILDTLRKGTEVTIHSSNAAGDWVNVTYTAKGRARTGWVSAKFVQQVGQKVTLTVLNSSTQTIYLLHVSPSTSSQWGDDVLGPRTTIAPGQRFQMQLEPGTYDMWARSPELETIATVFDVVVAANYTWNVR